MKYAVSFEQNPKVWDCSFALWDSKYDVGYDWFDFDEMVDGVSVFDNIDDATDYARDVLPEVDFDMLYVVGASEDSYDTVCICPVIMHHV
jgi:hypothetical protein